MIGRRLVAALAALLAPVAALGAQATTASLAAGAVAVRFADQSALTVVTLSPSLRWSAPSALLTIDGTFSQVEVSGWSRQGVATASFYSPVSAGGFLAELGGSAGGTAFPDGASTAQLLGTLRGHRLGTSSALWLGGAVGSMYDGTQWRSVRQGELGLRRYLAASDLTVMLTPSVTDDTISYADLLGQYTANFPSVDLTLSLGGRVGAALPIPGGDQRLWGGLSLVAWMAPRTSLLLGVGTYPVDVTQGFPAGDYISASMRFGAARSARAAVGESRRRTRNAARMAGIESFALSRVGEDRVEIRVRAPGASSVELSGDITAWAAQALVSAGGGWWVARFKVTARTFELTLRVDGASWIVPPGTDVVTDEFGGRVGRVTVPGAM